jgi:flagellar biogenesis protein FliO
MRNAIALLVLGILAEPAFAAPLATGTGPSVPWGRLFVVLAFCLLLAWAAIALVRRHQQGSLANPLEGILGRAKNAMPRRIQIIETRRASQHGDLCLVECDGETYLLALTAQSATVLDRKPAPGKAPA